MFRFFGALTGVSSGNLMARIQHGYSYPPAQTSNAGFKRNRRTQLKLSAQRKNRSK
jgi:hypothetical protein